jgi:hypothetical protein
MPNYRNNLIGSEGMCGIKHMREHGLSSNGMQYLGQIGLHALALPGSENNDIQHFLNF